MKNWKNILFMILLGTLIFGVGYAQSSDAEAVQIALSNRKCFQASIHVDKSTLLDTKNKKSYFGDVTREDRSAAFTIVAYPNGESPGAHNRLTIVAYTKGGGHQEFAFTYQEHLLFFTLTESKVLATIMVIILNWANHLAMWSISYYSMSKLELM